MMVSKCILRKVKKKRKLSKISDFRLQSMKKIESPKMTSKVLYGLLIRSYEQFKYFSQTWNLTIAKNTNVNQLKSLYFEENKIENFPQFKPRGEVFWDHHFEPFRGWNSVLHDFWTFADLRWCFWQSSNFKFVKNT